MIRKAQVLAEQGIARTDLLVVIPAVGVLVPLMVGVIDAEVMEVQDQIGKERSDRTEDIATSQDLIRTCLLLRGEEAEEARREVREEKQRHKCLEPMLVSYLQLFAMHTEDIFSVTHLGFI